MLTNVNLDSSREELLRQMVKDRMDEIGIKATDEQLEQMADFVNGIVVLVQAIQKDCIVNKIKKEV